jgi:TolA-binding protein|tara:strand:- start:624 stop:968 length:345 start_codon:yes stop_codon:yes gene_type:complete
VDIIIKIASLIVNSEITPFMAITFFIMYNLKSQSEQNKKEISQLQNKVEKLHEHNNQVQEKELQKLKEKIEEQKEEILSRAKQHNNANAEASIKYIKELNSNLEEYLKHKDNER